MFFKNEKEKCFAYLSHTACDKNNFILDFHITPGNIHDSVAFSDLPIVMDKFLLSSVKTAHYYLAYFY